MDTAHRKRRAAIFLGILLAYCPCVLALDPSLDVSQYAHTAWKVSEGFSKGVIFSIAQTPDGYLWLGTEFGLLRFDGVRNTEWQPGSSSTTGVPDSICGASTRSTRSSEARASFSMPKS